MYAVFDKPPDWSKYNETGKRTKCVKNFFDVEDGPSFLTFGPNDTVTPTKNWTDHQSNSGYYQILNFWNKTENDEFKVDLMILTKDLTEADKADLQKMSSDPNPKCCF